MSNEETNNFAEVGSPVRLSGLAQSVHALFLHRFDQRPVVNGKPNPGYRKSYPSMEEIQRWCAGFSRQAISKAIEELILKGLIIRVEIGRPGQRANYVPIYALGLIGDYVNVSLHKSKTYKGKKVTESVKTDSTMSKQSLPKVSTNLDTISSTSSESNNRNKDRFTDLLHLLPKHLKGLTQGKNIDEPLDRLDAKGVPLQVTVSLITEQTFNGAGNPYSVLISRLNAFSLETHDLVAGRKEIYEQNRLIAEQIAEMERNKVAPDVASQRANEIREMLKGKP